MILASYYGMRFLIILTLLTLSACRPNESTIRGARDLDPPTTTTVESETVTPTPEPPRGAMETRSEAPIPTDTTTTAKPEDRPLKPHTP